MDCHVVMILILLSLELLHASPIKEDDNARPVTIRLIEKGPTPRIKRSADTDDNGQAMHILPERLVFGIPVQPQRDAILTLTKSLRLIPVVTSDGPIRPVQKNASVFTDTSGHSSMIVRREDGQYWLQGTFVHAGKEWNLEVLDGGHQLSPLHHKADQEAIAFEGDVVSSFVKAPKVPARQTANRNTTRHKRSVTNHVIETAVVVDYGDYEKWVAFRGASQAVADMQLWYTYVVESINIRFNNIQDSDITVGVMGTHLKILTNDTDDDFIEDLVSGGFFDGSASLDAFRDWVLVQDDIPASDHYMLFTGYDMANAAGMAFLGEVCTGNTMSVSENSFTPITPAVASHELGHCLSAIHDSLDGCDDADNYLMATTLSTASDTSNLWSFSSCSIAKFKSYLGGVSCTEPASTSLPDAIPAPASGARAGEVLSLDVQCQYAFQSSQSSYCNGFQTPDAVCDIIWCAIPNDPDGYCSGVLAHEFTSCGSYQCGLQWELAVVEITNNKSRAVSVMEQQYQRSFKFVIGRCLAFTVFLWCVSGQCVGITTTSTTTDSTTSTSTESTTSTSTDSTTSAITESTTSATTTTSTTSTSSTTTATTTTTNPTTTSTTTTTATAPSSTATTTTSASTTTSNAPTTTTTSATRVTTPDTITEPQNILGCLGNIFKLRKWIACMRAVIDNRKGK